MTKLIQRVSRVILAFFALIFLFIGAMNFQRYLTEHKDPKTAVIGLIVRHDDEKVVRYQYKGKTYSTAPVANVLKNFGKVGTRPKVYVNNHHPEKIYMKAGATGLLILSSVMIGWALLIGLVLFFEFWFIHQLKEMRATSDENIENEITSQTNKKE
ncbi:hypothetical protein [Pseudolactococcus insecticola]|uniref:DUF3592 domain-containing protein n=1 Tax=Pseudolactococcus insecticola TaxID=2709158 RepID=A0A6A0B6J4_9LACT|nr:hypothetical protein [Lactococcus insecticola]GFH40882.1 hypothetical protein Hs20B_12800 [Lactococcus insecticola]